MKRSDLLALGLEKDAVDSILELHKADAELWKTQKAELDEEIKDIKAKQSEFPPEDGKDWKAEYEAEVKAHKATVETHAEAKTTEAKRKAAREALKKLGANEEDLDIFLLDKVDYVKIEMDGDKLKDEKALDGYKDTYKRYFGEVKVQGTDPANPPKTGGAVDEKTQAKQAAEAAMGIKIPQTGG